MMSFPDKKEIQQYYDEHTLDKLDNFVDNNERVERAWLTLTEHLQHPPQKILEVGCGVGYICGRMNSFWKEAKVVGIDISPKSIEIAKKLFGSEKVSFIDGTLIPGKFSELFDLIILMDVYEHIAENERDILHIALKELLTENGIIFLSFPTPRHLARLKIHIPSAIQPVDEDITIETISRLGSAIGKEVLLYKEVSVWHQGDYAHAILGGRQWITESDRRGNGNISVKAMIKDKIKQKIFSRNSSQILTKEQKITLINRKLGIKYPV